MRRRSARSGTPRRRWASRRPRRRGPRAGGSSRRYRNRARAGRTPPRPRPPSRPTIRRAPARGRAGCAWARTRSSRWSCPSRTRRGWSCRPPPRPRPRGACDNGRVVRREPTLENPRGARGGDAPRAEVVLQRDRHAGQRARVFTLRDRGVDRRRLPRGPVGEHEVERVHVALARVTCARCCSSTSRALRRPARTSAAIATAESATATAPRPGCAATTEPAALGRRCAAAAPRPGESDGRGRIGAKDVDEGQWVRGRRHAGRVECRHLRGVIEDRAELRRERVELVVGERQASERRDVLDLGARERGCVRADEAKTLLVRVELAQRQVPPVVGPGDHSGSG